MRSNNRALSQSRPAMVLAVGAALLFLCSACDRKPTATGQDFSKSNAVTIVFGDADREITGGVRHISTEPDGPTARAVVEGMPCRRLNRADDDHGYLYFALDPSVKKKK